MMACRRGSGEVEISVFGAANGPVATLQVVSGSERMQAPARSEPSQLHEGTIAATAPAQSAVMTRFAKTGRLAVGVTPRPTPFPPAPVATARAFVDICRA